MKEENIKIWSDCIDGYRLLDSGDKMKLEEINGFRIVRPEPRAWWPKRLAKEDWQKAEMTFDTIQNKWINSTGSEIENIILDIGLSEIKSKIKFNNKSKHIGIFPEQKSEWIFMYEKIKKEKNLNPDKEIKVLNLFGYTGLASLACASAGALVTHVDASKHSIDWAKENQTISGLEKAPIRWILDDSIKFLQKEIRRGVKYDAIIMDPPSYGKGPNGEIWKIEEKLNILLELSKEILSNKPIFIILNMYSTELSSISINNMLYKLKNKFNKSIFGELVLKQENDLLLPMSIFTILEN